MFSDANLPEPLLISEIENPVRLVEIRQEDGIFFNSLFTNIRLVRAYIYDLLKKAAGNLPQGYHFVVYEAYRPMSAQIKLWDSVVAEQKRKSSSQYATFLPPIPIVREAAISPALPWTFR